MKILVCEKDRGIYAGFSLNKRGEFERLDLGCENLTTFTNIAIHDDACRIVLFHLPDRREFYQREGEGYNNLLGDNAVLIEMHDGWNLDDWVRRDFDSAPRLQAGILGLYLFQASDAALAVESGPENRQQCVALWDFFRACVVIPHDSFQQGVVQEFAKRFYPIKKRDDESVANALRSYFLSLHGPDDRLCHNRKTLESELEKHNVRFVSVEGGE
jgi:hypothetical protein